MGQPGHAGTDNDGFGPTRFERSTQAVAAGAAPSGSAPLVTGSAAPRTAAAGAPTTQVAAAPPGAVAPKAPAKASGRTGRARGPRRARLQLRNVNAWTVFKFACVLSLFLFLVWLIVVMLLFGLLNATGVVGDVNNSVTTINGPGSTGVLNGGRVFLYAVVIGAVNAILFIALTTIGSVVYNLCADLVGGIEVTLSERDS
jgi:Transmembrane domain of unknown function (DUF3566)